MINSWDVQKAVKRLCRRNLNLYSVGGQTATFGPWHSSSDQIEHREGSFFGFAVFKTLLSLRRALWTELWNVVVLCGRLHRLVTQKFSPSNESCQPMNFSQRISLFLSVSLFTHTHTHTHARAHRRQHGLRKEKVKERSTHSPAKK
jgi:hypothetical protein